MTELSYAERGQSDKDSAGQCAGVLLIALISNLVEKFYGAIRADALLGPIFKSHVADWKPHLGRNERFLGVGDAEVRSFRGESDAQAIGAAA